MTSLLRVPQESPNDDEVQLIEWAAADLAEVHKGELVAVLESTKSTYELYATEGGFLRHLGNVGETVRVGAIIAAVTATIDEPVPNTIEPKATSSNGSARATLTKKAEIVAKRLGVDARELIEWKQTGSIGQADVEAFVARVGSGNKAIALTAAETGVDVKIQAAPKHEPKRLLLVGAGGACVQILDATLRLPAIDPMGIVDDTPEKQGSDVLGVPVVGTVDQIEDLWSPEDFDGVCISVNDIAFRQRVFERLSAHGIPFLNVVDRDAHVGAGARMGAGNFLSAFSRIGPLTKVGNNNFLSSYVSLDHHSELGDHCTFGPGVMTSGTVIIGNAVVFGTGVFVEPQLTIGDSSRIASGAIIRTEVPPGSIVKVKHNQLIR